MKAIGTILGIALLVLVGFWIFDNGDADLADNANATTTEMDFTGIGGPEEGFDPLEGVDDSYLNDSGSDADFEASKG